MKRVLSQHFLIIILFILLTGCSAKISVSRQHFVDQTDSRLPQEEKTIIKALFGDLDRDGDLDLIFLTDRNTTNEQIIFLLNDGRGHFKDNTLTRIPELYKNFQEVRLIDVNGDEALDILLLGGIPDKNLASSVGQQVESERKRDYLLINDTYGTFTDETSTRLPEIGNGYEEIKSGDVDNDGNVDILITGSNVPSLLFINIGRGVFRDETLARLPTLDKGVQEALLGDVDGDGDTDIFFAMENMKNILLINNGEGIYTDESEVMLPKILDNARDAAMEDIDGDGDLDIVVVIDKLTTERSETVEQQNMEKYEPFSNANLEHGSISTGWSQEGNAWQIWSMNENISLDHTKPLPEEGTFYAVSFNPENRATGEEATGTIRSQNFLLPINAKIFSFLKTGWDGQFGDQGKNFFYLRRSSDGTELKKATPSLSDSWDLEVWDITDIAGENVYFEAVDKNSDPVYASIGFDALKLSNTLSENERWEKDENYILINNGKGIFKDENLSVSPAEISYRVDIFDADNDGDMDILIFGVYGASVLINDGYGKFRDETYARLPYADTNFGEIAYGDIDLDEDMDIVAVHVGQGRLLVNELNPKIIHENIQKLKDLIVNLPAGYFKDGTPGLFVSALGEKGELVDIINQAETTKLPKVKAKFYDAAMKKLQKDFLERSDGCDALGKPDDNDWIVDCSAQLQVKSLVLDTIEVLNSILNH